MGDNGQGSNNPIQVPAQWGGGRHSGVSNMGVPHYNLGIVSAVPTRDAVSVLIFHVNPFCLKLECALRLPMWQGGKESACRCRRCRRRGFDL